MGHCTLLRWMTKFGLSNTSKKQFNEMKKAVELSPEKSLRERTLEAKRGSVVGSNSLLNKEYPPYAVLVGSPARIIASKFTIDQIMKHESLLYPEEERFTRTELEDIFNNYYSDKNDWNRPSKIRRHRVFISECTCAV